MSSPRDFPVPLEHTRHQAVLGPAYEEEFVEVDVFAVDNAGMFIPFSPALAISSFMMNGWRGFNPHGEKVAIDVFAMTTD